MPRIKHKGAAKNTKLNGSITNAASSLVAEDLAGWPDGSGSEPFTFVIGRGTANEEKCLATGRSGNTITGITRGYDDTTGIAHNDDEPVEHCLSAVVVDEANLHVNDDTRDDHCFSEDTEILTPDGWLGIDAADEGVQAWTFNLETERAEVEPIRAVHRYDAEQFPELVSLSNQDFGEALVTPDHRMVWRRRQHEWRVRKAKTLPVQFMIPARAEGAPTWLACPDDLVRLVAWAATEGCWQNGYMLITQKAGPLADRIRDLLVRLNLPFRENKVERGDMRMFRLGHGPLDYWLDEDKVPRRALLGMSDHQARLFIAEAILGDGHVTNLNGGNKLDRIDTWLAGGEQPSMQLASINPRFIDWVQELCVLRGFKTRVYSDGYIERLSIKATAYFDGLRRTLVPNYGRVWCVTVGSNATVIARRPGSAPFVAGNSQYLNTTRHDVTARHAFGTAFGTPAAPADVGTVAAQGAGTVPARDSHVHKIGAGAIASSSMFAAGVVGNAALASSSVGSANLVDASVTNAKLGVGAVASANIADGTITPTDIAAANVDGAAGVSSLRKLGAIQSQATLRALPVDGVGPAAAAVDHKHGTPFPSIRKANATSSLNLPNGGGTTPTDVGGATDTFSTVNANAEIHVVANASMNIGSTALGALNSLLVELVVDGVTQAGVISFAHSSLTDITIPGTRSWKVVLASAGSHTVKLQAHKAAAAGIANILTVDTGFTIVVVD